MRREEEGEGYQKVVGSAGGICTIVSCMFAACLSAGRKHQFLAVIVNPSTTCPLPGAALRAPDVGVEPVMLNPSSDALLLGGKGFDAPGPRALLVMDNPSAACARLGAALTAADTGVVDLVGT